MKKLMFSLCLLLALPLLFSFQERELSKEVTVIVTSEKKTTFDLVYDGKTTKGLKTPYKMKVSLTDKKLIFKSKKSKRVLKVKVENGKSTMTGSWAEVVLLIKDSKLTTFRND